MVNSGCENVCPARRPEPTLKHDVLGDGQNTLLEHGPNLVCKPVMHRGSAAGIGNKLDAKADFNECHRTHVKQIKQLASNESDDFALWFTPA